MAAVMEAFTFFPQSSPKLPAAALMFSPTLITKILLIFSLMIDAYEITPIATDRTTKISGVNLPRYAIQWSETDVDTEAKRVEIYEKWLSTTLADIGENASVDDIRKEISCYPGPPLTSQMTTLMDGMIPCDIFEDYINKTINEGKDLAQILRLNTTQIVWNNSISENVLNMKTRLKSVRDSFPQITDESTTNNLRDLNYQFALLSSEIPAEQYNAAQEDLNRVKQQLSSKLSNERINGTSHALLAKAESFRKPHYSDPARNFSAFNVSVSKYPWRPRNDSFSVLPVLTGNSRSTVLPPASLNNEISKRFRNFSMPAKLDPYYDRMVELAEQNNTSELKSLVQEVLQAPQLESPLRTLMNLFKGHVSTVKPSQESSSTSSGGKSMSEALSSKISDVINSDKMKNIRSKLETALNSL